jgi:hypothetical protein
MNVEIYTSLQNIIFVSVKPEIQIKIQIYKYVYYFEWHTMKRVTNINLCSFFF